MSRALIKYITALASAGRTLLALTGTSSGTCLCSFAIVVGVVFGIVSASISLIILAGMGILKMYLKRMGRKGNKHKIVLLARSKLNPI